ncbi:PRC-barrel domain-containing protein [Arthrobacter pascens]|uniref:PRC-barrel domain-containing protein n=1 Tax=Arthrobacter pascens TaxID=1677 RepID=UPI00196B40AE|nr:PRC-barrel domain-containing protein [Arthrobacter pascens]MBN3496235.1 PRC-barrel domain-containing protein [Arthrobacter pascens]MDR6556947.1 hypothetical protein [Arthrobacter pascens]
MLTKEHIDDLLNGGGSILSAGGDKIGSIGQIYADDNTGQPAWVTARTGLFGTSVSFVPLGGAHLQGRDIVVPYTKDQVADAPRVDGDGHLEPSDEDRLHKHYQRGGRVTAADVAAGRTGTERDAGFAAGRSGTYDAADASDTVGLEPIETDGVDGIRRR